MSKELTKDDLSPSVLQKEFDSGLWHEEIAEKYHCTSKWIIYKLVDKYGLQIERRNKKKEIPKYECKRCHRYFTILNKDGYCHNCESLLNKIETEQFSDGTDTDIHDKIINLRKQGLSYSAIAEQLNCAKSTISYHCNQSTKDKVNEKSERHKSEEPWKVKLISSLANFKGRKRGRGKIYQNKDWNKKLRTAVSKFKNRSKNMPKENYTYKDVIEYFGGTTVKCELTGRTIDLLVDDYNIDHILPVSRGGSNELDNMAFTIPQANTAKSDLTNEEFVALCKEVCENFGYDVIKRESSN